MEPLQPGSINAFFYPGSNWRNIPNYFEMQYLSNFFLQAQKRMS